MIRGTAMYEPVKDRNRRIELDGGDGKVMADPEVNSAISLQISLSRSGSVKIGDAEPLLPICIRPELRPKQNHVRLVSLDVFRGLTVALMILVDHAGGLVPSINHSPWNDVTLADFVMPFFLFIVGVSLALAYKKLPCRVVATRKAVLRALKLLLLGLFLQGGFLHGVNDLTYGVDIAQIRWTGILQRIAIAYIIAAICEIWLKGDDNVNSGPSLLKKYRLQGAVALLLTIVYLSLLYGLYVPDWEFQIPGGPSTPPQVFSVKCGVRGDTGPACNAVGMVDRYILGIEHLYKKPIYARTKQCSINSPDYGPRPPNAPSWCQAPFDPEGLLSSMMSIVTCLVGLHFGHIIIHFKDHKERVLHWLTASISVLLLGVVLDVSGMHVNKALYTFSYTCVTGGVSGILFTGIYIMVDVHGYRSPTVLFEWMGMHALTLFILAACNVVPVVLQGFYWKTPRNNFVRSLPELKNSLLTCSFFCTVRIIPLKETEKTQNIFRISKLPLTTYCTQLHKLCLYYSTTLQ